MPHLRTGKIARLPGNIRDQLNRNGPLSVSDGHRYDGLTTWSLKWTLAYKQVDSGCALHWANVSLEMIVSLPDLVDSAALPFDISFNTQSTTREYELFRILHEHHLQAGLQADVFWGLLSSKFETKSVSSLQSFISEARKARAGGGSVSNWFRPHCAGRACAAPGTAGCR